MNSLLKPSNYIRIKHIGLSLLISKYKITSNFQEVKDTLNRLNIHSEEVQNYTGNTHLGSISPKETRTLNKELGGFSPSLIVYKEFLSEIKAGLEKRAPVLDGDYRPVSKNELEEIWQEITLPKGQWRGEFLSDEYKLTDKAPYVLTYFLSRSRIDKKIVKLENYLAEDMRYDDKVIFEGGSGIDFNEWLIDKSNFGLPKENIGRGTLSYYAPRPNEESVAAVMVDSCGFCLSAYKHPTAPNPGMGVRHVRILK